MVPMEVATFYTVSRRMKKDGEGKNDNINLIRCMSHNL